jgi:hypothetical protein
MHLGFMVQSLLSADGSEVLGHYLTGEYGMLNQEGLNILGVSKYHELWGENGLAVQKCASVEPEKIQRAIMCLDEVIVFRKNDQAVKTSQKSRSQARKWKPHQQLLENIEQTRLALFGALGEVPQP